MTTTDLVPGRITSFRLEQGFGVITLDDGTPVKFDAGICAKMVPEEGMAVRLRTGPAKWGGGLKALYVEPVGAPVIAVVLPRSLEDQLATVQSEHLVSGLTESIMVELVAARFGGQSHYGTILELLDAYYTADPARGRSDGYLRRDAGTADPDGVLAELAVLLPDVKLPQQVRWTPRAPGAAVVESAPGSDIETVPYEKVDDLAIEVDAQPSAPDAPRGELVVRDPDGRERTLELASLEDAIELVNAALRRAGDGRRVYRLDSGGRWHAYVALASDRALRLAATLPFAPAPADVA